MSDSEKTVAADEQDIVRYEVAEGVAWVTMNRPEYHNAQNGRMTYLLDDAFKRAVADDAVKVIVLCGEGKNFSAGHDIGTPGRDVHLSQDRVTMWYDHADKEGGGVSIRSGSRGLFGYVPSLARDSQAHHRGCAGCLHCGRADVGLGV